MSESWWNRNFHCLSAHRKINMNNYPYSKIPLQELGIPSERLQQLSTEIRQNASKGVSTTISHRWERERGWFTLKNWFTQLVGTGMSKICKAGGGTGEQGKADVAVRVQMQSRGRIHSSLEDPSLLLLGLSTGWLKSAYIVEGNLLY